MKRRWFCLLLLAGLLNLNVWARQSGEKYMKCSPQTTILLNRYKSKALTKAALNNLTGSSSEKVGVFFKVATEEGWKELEAAGAVVNPINENLGTAYVELDKLEEMINSPHMKFVQVSTPVQMSLDTARAEWNSNADKALAGVNLKSPYRGQGVIVGVVDIGFDFTHPTLYDMEGKNYRVSWAWDQVDSPVKVERLTSEELLEKGSSTDSDREQHGTHVVGIAAGSGFGTTDLLKNDFGYSGVAPESEICLVATYMENTAIVNGVKAIFDYADEVQKPCVVNLSIGSTLGPHDGTDLFSESISALTGPGRIVVAAAGNDGNSDSYLNSEKGSKEKSTFVQFNKNKRNSVVELWGAEEEADFTVTVGIYNKKSRKYIGKRKSVAASSISNNESSTLSEILMDGVVASGGLYEGNNKYTLKLFFNQFPQEVEEDQVYELSFSSEETAVHARAVIDCSFSKEGADSLEVEKGMTHHSTGAPAEGLEVISVGNYVTRATPGEKNGHIASSSSYGPTYDGRLCPLVTAPGLAVRSSFNKYYVEYNQLENVDTTDFNGVAYPWGDMSGTSMSSPYVAGTIALWLQANPMLTPEDIRGVIARTSKSDVSITGECPNNRWGYGKIDTYNGLLDVLQLPVGNEEVFVDHPEEAVAVFADEMGQINIRWAEMPASFTVDVFDISGKKVGCETVGQAFSNEYTLSVPLRQCGIYVVRISTDKGEVVRKIKF